MSKERPVRQNFHKDSEYGVNKQINLELYASYVYQQLTHHFDRDDVALEGFTKFFQAQLVGELVHAHKLFEFQNERGGRIVLQDIPKLVKQDFCSGLKAVEAALDLEKLVTQALLEVHAIATANNDPQFQDFLETHYLTEQVDTIKKLGDHVTNLKRVGPNLGEYLFDKVTFS